MKAGRAHFSSLKNSRRSTYSSPSVSAAWYARIRAGLWLKSGQCMAVPSRPLTTALSISASESLPLAFSSISWKSLLRAALSGMTSCGISAILLANALRSCFRYSGRICVEYVGGWRSRPSPLSGRGCLLLDPQILGSMRRLFVRACSVLLHHVCIRVPKGDILLHENG